MRKRNVAAVQLPVSSLPAELPHGLDDCEYPVHPGVRVRQPAPVGIKRERAAGRCSLIRHKVRPFAGAAKPQVLQADQHRVGEGVVDHRQVDVGVRHPGHPHGLRPRLSSERRGQISHLGDHRVIMPFRYSQHRYTALSGVAGAFRRGNHHGRPGIGYQAAIDKVKWPRDPTRLVVLIEVERPIMKVGPRD